MTFFDDEVISVAQADAYKTLTRSKIDNDPGSAKARRAVISCHTAAVAYRYDGTTPDTSTKEYHQLAAGGSVTIDGYDNLVNLRVKLETGSTTAKLFVSYAY